jgi:UDP-hydrolysing UDP-N-acetyl-D-glucosamine 2-epimerase|tara:strand:- start:5580 stop:6743 length:1164 start_codon:yes stop_codon:yes gene_type:complete
MNKKKFKIIVTTFSRSEFGLLYNLIKEIIIDKDLSLKILVSGSHFSKKYGYTASEIYSFGFKNLIKVKMDLNNDSKNYLSRSVGKLTIELTKKLNKFKPDLVICMGDRYELLSLSTVITLLNIPLAHISGGEITWGAIDDQIRHAVSKLSHLHYVANLKYKKNLLNMGEENWRISVTGEPGLDNLSKIKKLSKKNIEKKLKINLQKKIILVTFHPVTHEIKQLKFQVTNLIKCLKSLNYQIIITGANADHGGDYINSQFKELSEQYINICFFNSLGIQTYLSLLKYTSFVIGNSSSALVELPSYGVYAINIGNRQKGRIQGKNIVNVNYNLKSIMNGIEKIKLLRRFNLFHNPYYKKNSSKKIVNHFKNYLNKYDKEKILAKKFNGE